uniref:Zinc finger MYM-type protein 4-like n=1 Tax=Seriola lalandi dorsalis TaxID=1841481 RepID=A0A3B4Y099_SERLL
MEAVSEAEANVDVGDPDLVCGSPPRLSEYGEEDNVVAAEKERESKETEHKETEKAVVPSTSVSPQNPSSSQSSVSSDKTLSTALTSHDGEPGSTSEAGKEGTVVKTEEESELNEENFAVNDKRLKESPAEPDVSEDTDMTSDGKKETNTDKDSDSREDVGAQQEKESRGCKLRVSAADDLDEMMDIGTVDQMEQEERLQAVTRSIKSSPSPPLVKVKDEPIDEEYEQALVSSTTTASVKDEPNTAKDDLRIGSVFSVTPASETQTLPEVSPSSSHMSCSHCKKSLMKGQTAFQRKGSPALFCSTACLTTSLPTVKGVTKICHNCQKLIFRPQDVILAPDAKGVMKEFCSQNCLTSFNYKKNSSYRKAAVSKNPQQPTMDDSNKTLCNAECLNKYKEMRGCIGHCDTCGKNTVPAYHLAMSDTSIRNFCTLPCVMAFQEKFKKSQKQVNVFTKLPIGSTQIQAVTPVQPPQDVSNEPKLNCSQCTCNITFKPEVIQIKDKMVFVCSVDCSHEFKKANYVTSLCEYCKIEKITRDAKRINNKDCYFCSDGCKLLFRHDLTKNWGKHCHSCVYCHCVSKKLVTAQYGGSTEEFCSEECRSRYTMLFCHVRLNAVIKVIVTLKKVKHFCDLSCLLQFCSDKVATQGEVFKGAPSAEPQLTPLCFLLLCFLESTDTVEATPVIANVISLAGTPTGKSNAPDRTISIQTETVKPHPPPPGPKILKNKALLCRPLVQNKGVSCKTQTADVESQTDDIFPKIMVLPVPVPVFVPVPMNMYSQCTPRPVGLPLPLPVPMFLPVTMDSAERIVETIQEIKEKIPSDPFEAELILMAEMVAEQDEKNDKPERPKEKVMEKQTERHEAAAPDGERNEPPPPAPPPMDIEADFTFIVVILVLQPPLSLSALSKGRKSQRSSKAAETTSQRGSAHKAMAVEVPKLKSQYGVDAWKRWIQWRQTQPNLEKPRFSRPMELKEDILRCTTAELSYGLCCFITELKRPNGEPYSPDSLFYLCLGIQQYLFENGRVENIFMDRFYNKFSTEFTSMLRGFKPSVTAGGYIHSRVEEEFLWDCKQLGAYSPIVLLNTLLFFCCKYFGFTTVEQHRQLSFAHVMRCTKTNPNNTKTTFLRFYPPISIHEVPAKKRKEEESKEDILEMVENTENPLRCPVRLYEFYLSKCSESVKQRTNLFYLHPERCCVPNSPLWFSSTALDDSTMEAMLIRILTVRELHLRTKKEGVTEQKTGSDPPFIPDEEDDEESE